MVFEVQFALLSAKNEVSGGVIALDGFNIESSAPNTVAKFKCIYPLSVDIDSLPFAVKRRSKTWDSTDFGSLDDGFAMDLDGYNKHLGMPLTVTVNWGLNLSQIQFYFNECALKGDTLGAIEIPIIRDGCYSEVLQVSRKDGSAISQSFVFPTFSVQGEEKSTQVRKIFPKIKSKI